MGGYGSGRPGWHQKAEHLRSIDVNRLNKAGHLRPGNVGGWQWTCDGEKVASIGTRGEHGQLRLIFRTQSYGQDWQDTDEPIPITWVPCHHGGQRPYFQCPGVVNGRWCGRRVGKLYLSGRYFLCRHCQRVAYASQSESRQDRLMRKANKRRAVLGDENGIEGYVKKPKGIHWATYWRHMNVIDYSEKQADLAFIGWVSRRFPGMKIDDLLK